MSIPSLTSRIEAILYLKGRPISLSELAELARDEPDQVRTAIAMLTTSYAQRDTALEVVEQSGRYCLQLRPALADLVKNMLPVNLSTATLRTLATIALKNASFNPIWWTYGAQALTTTSRNFWPRTS